MSDSNQPRWMFHQESQQYYYYDAYSDTLIFQNGHRMPRPPNIPRTSFASASSQAAGTPSLSSFAPHPLPQNPAYVSGPAAQQFAGTTTGSGPSSGSQRPIASSSRAPVVRPERARRLSSSVDALTQNLAAVTVSTQVPQSSASRQPQPVTPSVTVGSNGQRVVAATDPTTNLRTIIQTAPVTAITDPALLQSGIFARSRLIPSDTEVTEKLFKSFRLRDQPRKFFTVGKVFLVLWVEPAGESNTGVTGLEIGTTIGRYGERAFSKVRRFVVVREGDNYCSALPITSYGHRGVGKPGVNKSEHSVIHTTKTPPQPLQAELPLRDEEGMRPHAIRVDADDPIDKLDSLSRLDYGKVHTIQHNIKVKAFGKVNPRSMFALINQFGNVWRALPAGGIPSISGAAEEAKQSQARVPGSTTAQRVPQQVSARVSAGDRSERSMQAQSIPAQRSVEQDSAAQVRADVRTAVQALVQQGYTEEQAERAIREELARRRQAQEGARRQANQDEESSSEDDESTSNQQRGVVTQSRPPESSQGRSGSTQLSATRTPTSSQATTSTRAGAQTHLQPQPQARSSGASISSTTQSQASRVQAEAMMARLLQEGKTRDEALAIIRARFSSGRNS